MDEERRELAPDVSSRNADTESGGEAVRSGIKCRAEDDTEARAPEWIIGNGVARGLRRCRGDAGTLLLLLLEPEMCSFGIS